MAFHTNIDRPPPDSASAIEKRLPHLPLSIFGQERLIDQPPRAALPLVTSSETKSSPPPARIEMARAETDALVAASEREPRTPEPLAPVPPPAAQRLAALPEPMHLLPRTPTAEISATEVAPDDPSPRARSATTRSRSRSRPTQQTAAGAKTAPNKEEQAATVQKIPRWAQQMFESDWQTRTFAYQR